VKKIKLLLLPLQNHQKKINNHKILQIILILQIKKKQKLHLIIIIKMKNQKHEKKKYGKK